MKKGIHPETYRLVAFKDMSNDTVFVTRSCAPSKETITVEGVEYPLVKLEISNTSHPFYTGKVKLVDTAGRVDMFYQRYKSPVSSVTKIPFSVLVSTRMGIVALTAIILYSLPVLPVGGTGFFCV